MQRRELRAVGYDWHGITVEKATSDGNPESVGLEGRTFWARCFAEAAFLQKVNLTVDPMVLWKTRCKIELRTPRMKKRRPIRARVYNEWVNYLILRGILGRRVKDIPECTLRKMARLVRQLHRRDFPDHMMYPDVREFVHWVYDIGLDCFVHTGQEDERVQDQGQRCNVPFQRIGCVFTTHRLKSSKMTKDFWEQVMAELGFHPWQMVVIDNNAVQGTFCTTLGIPALILDRDGVQGEFFRKRGLRLRGIQILDTPSQIPIRAAFVAFTRTQQEMRDWILAMNPQRQLCLRRVR